MPTLRQGEACLQAIRVLTAHPSEQPLTTEETLALQAFPGFGPLALHIFPNPVTGEYPSPSWAALGDELKSLLSPLEYASAKRATFTAFYTSNVVMTALHQILDRLGVPEDATVLEPGCGHGAFLQIAHPHWRWIGIEQDRISGQIAQLLYPDADIRMENFADTQMSLPVDAVIGNVPFAEITYAYRGSRYALHDFCLVKSLDLLRPGGVLAVVTSHYTLDKQDPTVRQQLAAQADFLGAIRLPSTAFEDQGTRVVADLLILRKRAPGQTEAHVDPTWIQANPCDISGTKLPFNSYFLNQPTMILGRCSLENRLYASGYSIEPTGDLATQLTMALETLQPPPGDTQVMLETLSTPTTLTRIPVPNQPHLTEGSFFLTRDGTIAQVTDGAGLAVMYGGRLLHALTGTTGPRLSALTLLRDAARLVLRSQHMGASLAVREATRARLNRVYDLFVDTYGPINHTTISIRTDGTVVRSMPNLVKFREDPDAMLVMALEQYDADTDTATTSDICRRDVVGTTPPLTQVTSASDALIASLDRYGQVNLEYMTSLYAVSCEALLDELGHLVYDDPATGAWLTADAYLSGNVRAKLATAKEATCRQDGQRFLRHVEALEAIQPPDILPSEIDANLGAPWIPVTDIHAFAITLFDVSRGAIQVAHLAKDALWVIVGMGWEAKSSVSILTDYGTPRIDGLTLLTQALNMQLPIIYDYIPKADGTKEARLNPNDTLAAREKQQKIKDAFKVWLWQDQDRSERLVRIYNEQYNHLRLRSFDGRHLEFPDMNPAIIPHAHQRDAVWRIMSTRNTLLAHCVGSGKSLIIAASIMKLRQAGLMRRALIVVPNHLLEQFGREFLHLYPNAKLLIAHKEDCTKDKRKQLTARILSADWDGILITHSAFGLLSMSVAYQQAFIQREIEAYDALLKDATWSDDRNQRNLIKPIEKQKAAYEQRLTELQSDKRKDDGLVFDELGIDGLFIDESQAFKNLQTPTKMTRVAGISRTGSERSFDMAMKCDYLNAMGNGRIIFASGTPISNTMVEMYTLQRYLDPQGLREAGIEHFDAWAASFGEVIESMEISPDGQTLRARSRFAKFVNLPELQQLFRHFADVRLADSLDLPKPRLRSGKAQVIAVPMTDRQMDLQDELVERYEAIRNGLVKPWDDNALAITGDGRKLALDARLLTREAMGEEAPKVQALVAEVVDTYQRTMADRGTQLIFCDLGVNPNAWEFTVYQAILEGLMAQGIPPHELACIGDANTDAKKHQLFAQVRSGKIRVMLGSTERMGTGMNVQQRLIRIHHIDAPWKPSEVEQRDGRMLRQGNMYAAMGREVEITRYVTEGSFDAFMWQALETKARFITQLMSGTLAERQASDLGEQTLSYAEVKAIASGNPAMLTLAELEAELKRYTIRQRTHTDEQYLASKRLRTLPDEIARGQADLTALTADQQGFAADPTDAITIQGMAAETEIPMPEALGKILEAINWFTAEPRTIRLGVYRGFSWGIDLHPARIPEVSLTGQAHRTAILDRRRLRPESIMHMTESLLARLEWDTRAAEQRVTLARSQLAAYQALQGQPFADAAHVERLRQLQDDLERALSTRDDARSETISTVINTWTALKAQRTETPTTTRLEASQPPKMRSIITQLASETQINAS